MEEKKLDSIIKVTESQIDRNNIKDQSFLNLMGFLNSYITKSTSQNTLKTKIEGLLQEKLDNEEEEIPYGVLIKLLEVLSKNEVEASIPILKIIEQANKVPDKEPAISVGSGSRDKNNPSISGDELKKVKGFLQTIEDLEKTEFGEKE